RTETGSNVGGDCTHARRQAKMPCALMLLMFFSSFFAVRPHDYLVGQFCYLIGHAKGFKVGQGPIFAAITPRVKIHVGKRSILRVLNSKATWNLNNFPRPREETRGARRNKRKHLSPHD